MSATRTTHSHDKILPHEGLTFDDLLLMPRHTDFKRADVDLTTRLHDKLVLKLPVLSSPMDTVTEAPMAAAMAQNGGLGIIHRNINVEDQAAMVKEAKSMKIRNLDEAATDDSGRLLVGAAVGAGADLEERVDALLDAEVDVIVVDSGHGHSQFIMDGVKHIKKRKPDQVVMAGNVATAEGARALVECGADILRVGIGPGSICTTRIVTGMGVPQITAILNSVEGAKGEATIVADGGIRQMGDMAKALGAGAHAVMLGSLLAGYEQSPGEVLKFNDQKYKQYRGMGSIPAMKKGSAERYGQSFKTESSKFIAEGVEGLVPYRGEVVDFLYQVAGSLHSAFYYVGSRGMDEFHANAQFLRITHAGLLESHPHTIRVSHAGGNYL
jgi:IMP dehydrogenase